MFTIHVIGRLTGRELTSVDTLIDGSIILVVWLTNLALLGSYEGSSSISAVEEFRRISQASLLCFLITSTVAYMTKSDPARVLALAIPALGLFLIALGRSGIRKWDRKRKKMGIANLNVLVIGADEYASELLNTLRLTPQLGLRYIGNYHLPSHVIHESDASWMNQLIALIDDKDVQVLIIQDAPGAHAGLVSRISWEVSSRSVQIYIAPSFTNVLGPRLEMREHAILGLISLEEPALNMPEKFLKRLFDLVVASLAIILTLPLMLFISAVIMVKDPGPIIFKQPRIGYRGKQFTFIKFRTMVVGADQMRDDILGKPDEEMVNRYRNDPRILPFGKVLRRYSLDELPQLFSVLSGKMSIVGPRPLLIDELPLLDDVDHRRHLTKPGLTGLWQVNGRKETTWEERIQMDLNYIHNWSIGLDLSIFLKTFYVILTGHGSY